MAVEKLVSEEYGPDRYSSLKGVNIYIESEQAVARLGMKGERSQRMFCDLSTFFRTFKFDKVLTDDEKDSASPSIIVFATYIGEKHPKIKYNTKVAIKTFLSVRHGAPMPLGARNDSSIQMLLSEWWIYENGIKTIMDDANSTNFVKCYATGQCNAKEIIEQLDIHAPTDAIIDKFARILKFAIINAPALAYNDGSRGPLIPAINPNDIQLNMIINELSPNTMGLFDYLKIAPRSDAAAVQLQIFHALHILERYGIAHNDMHPGNILVQLNPDEQAINYDIGGGVHYRVDISSMTKPAKALLFDWDRGTSVGHYNSGLLKWACPQFAQCPDFLPGADAVSFAENCYVYGLPKIPDLDYIQGRPCFKHEGKCLSAADEAAAVKRAQFLRIFGPNGDFTAVARIIIFLTVKHRYFYPFLVTELTEAIKSCRSLLEASGEPVPLYALLPFMAAKPDRKREAQAHAVQPLTGRLRVDSPLRHAAVLLRRKPPAPIVPAGEASIYAGIMPDPEVPALEVPGRAVLKPRRRLPPK